MVSMMTMRYKTDNIQQDYGFIRHSLVFIHDKLSMASTLTNVCMELLLKIPADVSID